MKTYLRIGKHTGIILDEKALQMVAMNQFNPKGAHKEWKRFIRIRRYLLTAMRAFDKEVDRHRI